MNVFSASLRGIIGNPEMTVPLETVQLEKERRMERIEICNTKVRITQCKA